MMFLFHREKSIITVVKFGFNAMQSNQDDSLIKNSLMLTNIVMANLKHSTSAHLDPPFKIYNPFA